MKGRGRWLVWLAAFWLWTVGFGTAWAQPQAPQLACALTDGSGTALWMLQDANRTTKLTWPGGALTLESEEPIAALYLIWDKPPGAWTGQAGEQPLRGGEEGFIHEYIPLESPVRQLTLTLPEGALCCDVYAFGQGALPDWVQQWEPPLEDADLLLLPTHADDEHLFFGGTMPYYAGQLGKKVQVAYFTNHWAEPYRPHELLNGLWTVGVRNYPVMSDFVDLYAGSLEEARALYDEEEAIAWQVEQLRRFRPEVVVGHDVNGEYGHGVHMYNTDTLRQALERSGDGAQYPQSAARWGVWEVPKTYLHLYPENPIVMDWSQPLSAFGGKTAVEMARQGFAQHVSQQTYFVVEDYGPYDCRLFGLYRSQVGPDEAGGDFFENLTEEMYSDYQPPEAQSQPEPTPPAQTPSPEAVSTPDEPEQTSPQTEADEQTWLPAVLLGALLAALLAGCWIGAKRRRKG